MTRNIENAKGAAFDAETANANLHDIRQEIAVFNQICNDAEYTDTEAVWDLLRRINDWAGGDELRDSI